MTFGFKRFAAIAVAAAGIITAQGASAGALFTHTGGNNEWINSSAWTGGSGFPDQTTEDARLVSSTSTSVRVNVSIGGIQGDAGSTLSVIRNGSAVGTFTLNGIAAGGNTPFTASTLDNLSVSNDGTFVNTGSSSLTINRFTVRDNGLFRNFPNATGRMDLTGGTKILQDNAVMDNYGTLELSSFMSIRNNATLNNDLGGTFTHSAGDMYSFGSSRVLNDATFTNTGGNLFLSGSALFQNTVNFTQTAGNTDIGNGSFVNANSFNNFGTYNHDGGTTNIHGGATLLNDSFYNHDGGTLTVHASGLFKNDFVNTISGGTVQINAGGTLNGTGFASTTLTGGTLRVNGEMIQTGVTINGGTLDGTGTVRSNIANNGGTVGPGNSPGTLTVDGNFAQGPGGTLAIEIDSLLAFDVLDILGTATLAGILDLTVDAGYAAAAQDGDMFTIVEWGSFSGAFDTVNGLNFAAGKFFTLDYGMNGLTLTVNAETVVAASEPGAMALFGLGLAGIGFVRRKRQRV
jgi:hypothetical protein